MVSQNVYFVLTQIVLRLIVENDNEISKFSKESYFKLSGIFTSIIKKSKKPGKHVKFHPIHESAAPASVEYKPTTKYK